MNKHFYQQHSVDKAKNVRATRKPAAETKLDWISAEFQILVGQIKNTCPQLCYTENIKNGDVAKSIAESWSRNQ